MSRIRALRGWKYYVGWGFVAVSSFVLAFFLSMMAVAYLVTQVCPE